MLGHSVFVRWTHPRFARLRLAAVMSLAVTALGLLVPTAAFAGPNEGDFFSAANSARASAGLHAYAYASDLASVARGQAARMAASGVLAHNPNLGSAISNWQGLAENVGTGTDWATIHQAFMDSPEHRAAILDSGYTEMGVGTAVDKKGNLWVSEVFRLPAGVSPPQSGGSGSASAGSSSTPSASSASTSGATPSAPTPSPEAILRGKIRQAREAVTNRGNRAHHIKRDPLVAALEYSTVMGTIGG